MPIAGRALAEAFIRVRADMTSVGPDISRGLDTAVSTGSRSAGRRMKDAVAAPIKQGLAEGIRAADPGGAAVGGRFRQGLIGRLRGIAADTTKAGQDAGTGIDRGLSGKMRDVAATTTRGGQTAGTGFARGISSRMRGVATDVERTGRTAGTGFAREAGRATEGQGSYLKRAGHSAGESLVGAFAAVEVGTRVVEFFTDSVAAASDLNEAGNALQQTFGSASGDVTRWAQSAATSLGMSTLEAEQAATTFGVFARQAGLAGGQAAGFSQKMTGLATDLASFYNTSPADAIEAIGSALRGESEPIRRYGVLLDDATLRQSAFRLGLISTTKNALTPQQRVLAVQAEILRQTGAAQGDFARTSGGLANQQRILAAEMENAKASLGQSLLPVMLQATHFLTSAVVPALDATFRALGAIPGPVYAAAAGIAALYGAFRIGSAIRASQTFTDIGRAMQWMGLRSVEAAAAEGVQTAAAGRQAVANDAAAAAGTRLGTAMGRLAVAAGVVGLAAISVQLASWSGGATTAKVSTDALRASLTELGRTGATSGAALDVFKQGWGPFSQDVRNSGQAMTEFGSLAAGALGSVNESWTGWIGRMQSGSDRMSRLTAITQQYDTVLTQMVAGGSASEARAVFDQLAASAQREGVSIDQVRALFPQYTAAVTAAGTGSAGAAGGIAAAGAAAAASAGALGRQGITLGALVAQYPKYRDAIVASVGPTVAAAGDTTVLSAAQVSAASAAVRHKQALDALTNSLDANKNAVLQNRGGETAYWAALQATRDALRTNGRTLDVHTAKGRANRTALDDLARASLSYLGTIRQNIGTGPVFRRTLDQQWQRLYAAALRFTGSTTAARRYANQILSTPKAAVTRVTTPGMTAAQRAFANLTRGIRNVPSKGVTIRINGDGSVTRILTSGGHTTSTTMRAAGGYVSGPGTSTSDSIPARLSDGEYVVNAAATSRHRQLLEAINSGRSAPAVKLAAGGPVVSRNVRAAVQMRNVVKGQDLPGMFSRGFNAIIATYQRTLRDYAKNALLNSSIFGGPGGPQPSGAGAARWGPMVHRALSVMGLSQTLWDNWMRQISSESGGNPGITQQIHDVNSGGNEARGLLQVIPPTFRAYHVAGTSWNIFDAWANMLAAMNYAKHRYGSSMEAVIGHGHGYAAGTRYADPGWAVLGEHGPELARLGRGGEVRTATETRSLERRAAGGDLVRLHPDTVAQLAGVMAAALSRQPIVLDGRTLAGYVDRSMGAFSLSGRG